MSNLRNDVYELKACEFTDTNRNAWITTDDGTDLGGYYSYQGNPEGNLDANIGAYCLDTTNGQLYVKTTDTIGVGSGTGWRLALKLGNTATLSQGDIFYVNSSGQIVPLSAGSDDQVLTLASGIPSWADASGGADFSATSDIYDEFQYESYSGHMVDGIFPWLKGGSIVDAGGNTYQEAGTVGIWNWTVTRASSAVAGSLFAGKSGYELYRLGSSVHTFNWRIKIPTVSAGSNSFKTLIGCCSFDNKDTPGTNPDEGVYFSNVDDENSGNWVLECRDGGTSSTTNSSTAPDTGWHTYTITVNAAASSVEFFIDGSSQGTVTTNIPTTGISPFIKIDVEDNSTSGVVRTDAYWHSVTRS